MYKQYDTATVKCKGVTWMDLIYTHTFEKDGDACRKNETERRRKIMVKKNEGEERKELHAGHFLLMIVLNDTYQGGKRRIGVSMHT